MGVSTTTSGTGTITLGSALAAGASINSCSFLLPATSGVANGQTVSYLILDSNGAWEVGTGVYTTAGTTLTRVLTISSTGSLLSLSGSNSQVFITARKEDIVNTANNGSDFANVDTTRRTLLAVGGIKVTTYTSGVTGWTADTNMLWADAEGWGGGAGGGGVAGSVSDIYGGGGGGSGGYSRSIITAAAAAAAGVKSVTIGAGGAGGAAGNNPGSGGGTTSIVGLTGPTTLLQANGGVGGNGASSAGAPSSGTGAGAGTGNVSAIAGNSGVAGYYWPGSGAGPFQWSAAGGSSSRGGVNSGALGAGGASAGNASAANSGSGGSGAVSANSAGTAAGGNGGSGYVTIIEYLK